MPRPFDSSLISVRFPLNYYEQKSILLAREDVDPDGMNILIRFACPHVASLLVNRIFRNGYFLKWEDSIGLEIVKSAGSPLSLHEAERIINCLAARGFFDNELWVTQKVLSNTFIQQTWRKEMKRMKRSRIEISPEYELKNEVEPVVA